MSEFRYEVLDSQGALRTGTLEAASAPEAIAALRAEGNTVYAIEPAGPSHGFFRKRDRLGAKDVLEFNEILASLVKSGLPLPPGIESVARDMHNRRVKPVLEELHRGLEQGLSIEQALGGAASGLPPVYVSMIRAGEQTGNLPGVLALLTRYSRQMLDFQGQFRAIIAYPILVSMVLVFIASFLGAFVAPRIVAIYTELGAPLPLPTRALIAAADYIPVGLLVFGIAFAVMFLSWRNAMQRAVSDPRAGLFIENIRRSVPLFGKLYVATVSGRFSRTLEMLLKSQAQVPQGIMLAAAATGSPAFRHGCGTAAEAIANGNPIASALEKTGLFRPSFIWMLSQGETRGVLEDTMGNLADSCEREVTARGRALLAAVMPVCMSVLGLVVLFTALAMLAPLFKAPTLVVM